jgi:hypothetical protein
MQACHKCLVVSITEHDCGSSVCTSVPIATREPAHFAITWHLEGHLSPCKAVNVVLIIPVEFLRSTVQVVE